MNALALFTLDIRINTDNFNTIIVFATTTLQLSTDKISERILNCSNVLQSAHEHGAPIIATKVPGHEKRGRERCIHAPSMISLPILSLHIRD